jgi:hypothetical protein
LLVVALHVGQGFGQDAGLLVRRDRHGVFSGGAAPRAGRRFTGRCGAAEGAAAELPSVSSRAPAPAARPRRAARQSPPRCAPRSR